MERAWYLYRSGFSSNFGICLRKGWMIAKTWAKERAEKEQHPELAENAAIISALFNSDTHKAAFYSNMPSGAYWGD
jgi:hypothetical protein